MDNTDQLITRNDKSPNRSNLDSKTSVIHQGGLLEDINLKPLINPPPPLPGVFIFDRPTHSTNISQVASSFNHTSNQLEPTYSQSITNFSEPILPVSYGKPRYSETNINEIHSDQEVFQTTSLNLYDFHLNHNEKELKSLEPSIPSGGDEMLPPDGNVYQSLEPVPHSLYDVPPNSDHKVYQQLQAVDQTDYCMNAGPYQQLSPLSEDGNRLQEETKTYQQLKPVVPVTETKTFQQLRPVVPTFDAPHYANSKLYQQLRQPTNRELRANYVADTRTYHQLRPVTVSEFEQTRHSLPNHANKHMYSSPSGRISTSAKSNSYSQPIRHDQPTNIPYQNIQNVNSNDCRRSLSNSSIHENNNRKYLDLKGKTLSKTQLGGFQINKPKVYLELRNPSVRQSIGMSYQNNQSAENFQYRGLAQKYDAHTMSTSYQDVCPPLPVQSLPQSSESKDGKFRLPSPYEFNLPQNNSPNKYKLPKILGPNEYNSQQFMKTPEKVQTSINQHFQTSNESKHVSVSMKTSFTNSYIKPSFSGDKMSKPPLSLPKSPVCYGDSSAINKGNYPRTSSYVKEDHGENMSLYEGMSGIVPSTNSAFEMHPINKQLTNALTGVITSVSDSKSPTSIAQTSIVGSTKEDYKIKQPNNKLNFNSKTEKSNILEETLSDRLTNVSNNQKIPENNLFYSCTEENTKVPKKTAFSETKTIEQIQDVNLVQFKASPKLNSKVKSIGLSEVDTKINLKNVANKSVSVIKLLNEELQVSKFDGDLFCKRQESNAGIENAQNEVHASNLNIEKLNIHVPYSNSSVNICNEDKKNEDISDSIIEPPLQFRSEENDDNTHCRNSCTPPHLDLKTIKTEHLSPTKKELSSENVCILPESNRADREGNEPGLVDSSLSVKPSSSVADVDEMPKCVVKKFRKRKLEQTPGKSTESDAKIEKEKVEVHLECDVVNSLKEKENEPTLSEHIVKKRKYKKRMSGIPRGPYKKKRSHKRGPYKKTKLKLELMKRELEDFIKIEDQESMKLPDTNVDVPNRKKRKYTKRAARWYKKDQLSAASNIEVTRTKRKYTKRQVKVEPDDDDDHQPRKYKQSTRTELKLEFIDPLEEGLISDDEGEVVFLGFDMPDEEDDTILGFDLSPSRDDWDPFNSFFGALDPDCVTVECDPRSLLQAPSNTTSCPECSKAFDSHQELVNHMQLHAAAIQNSQSAQPFTCTVCFQGFGAKEQLDKHTRWIHDGFKKFRCPLCPKRFTTSTYAKRHVETIHGEVSTEIMYFCADCPLTFTTEKALKTHDNKTHKHKLHQCDKCLKYFEKASNLQRHKQTHDEAGQSYPCAYCNQGFSSRELLHTHWTIHSDKKPFKCEACGRAFTSISSFKRHKILHSGEKLFRCEICQRSFSLLSTLKTHLLIHTGARRFECKLCHKKFNRRDVLNAHQWIHTGEKKFQCDVCSQKFRWRHAVRSHKLIYHSTEKPYVCEVCGKRFSHPDSYKKHGEVHAEKIFFCQICLKSFSRRSTLKAHIIIHTNLKPFFCDMCNKGFRSKSHLRNHFLVHTKEKPWLCKFCNKTYKDRNQLRRHKRVVHCKAFYKKVLPDLSGNTKTVKHFKKKKPVENKLSGDCITTVEDEVFSSEADVDVKLPEHFISFSTNDVLPETKEEVHIIPPSVF